MENDTPKLSIVPDDPKAREREELEAAVERLVWPTRELAANLLRIIRGAGRPGYLPQQIIDLSGMILEAVQVTKQNYEIYTTIERTLHEGLPSWEEQRTEMDEVRRSVLRGSLQYVASKLVFQHAQMAQGRDELALGFSQVEARIKARQERMHEEELRFTRRPDVQKVKPKRQAKPKPKEAPKALNYITPDKPKAKKVEAEPAKPRSTADFMRRRAEELGG